MINFYHTSLEITTATLQLFSSFSSSSFFPAAEKSFSLTITATVVSQGCADEVTEEGMGSVWS